MQDGVTVARAIELPDRVENMGAQLIKAVASNTNDTAGDGTTTATVLARSIYREGCKSVAAGLAPMDLRRGIQLAVDKVVQLLKDAAVPITTKEETAQVFCFLDFVLAAAAAHLFHCYSALTSVFPGCYYCCQW